MVRRLTGWVACLFALASCYKSSVGLRGVAGLGEVMTQGSRETADSEPVPAIVDAHAYFDNPMDEQGQQPSWGMEVAFRGANVLGAVIMPSQMRFIPQIDKRFAVKLVLCGSGETASAQKSLAHGLEKGRYRCVKINADTSFVEANIALAAKHRVPVVLDGRTADSPKKLNWEPLFSAHPRVNFVLAALGSPGIAEAARYVAKYPNVFVDMGLVVFPNATVKSPVEITKLLSAALLPFAKFPQKVMFASSWPKSLVNPGVDAIRETFAKDAWPMVFHGNADRVFRMELDSSLFDISLSNGGKKQNAPAGK